MSRPRRVAALAVAGLLALTAAPPAAAVGNLEAARRALGALATPAAPAPGAPSPAVGPEERVQRLLALAAVDDPASGDEAARLWAGVQADAPRYAATGPAARAKLAILAAALQADPHQVGGMDVLADLATPTAGTTAPTPGDLALTVIALARHEQPVPPALLRQLTASVNADGGAGASPHASDPVTTGLVLQGLAALPDSVSARQALDQAAAWGVAHLPEGRYDGPDPLRATVALATGLQAAGQEQPRSIQWIVAQQDAAGSWPGSGGPALTSDAAILLANTSLVTLDAPHLAETVRTPASGGPSSVPGPAATQPTASATSPAGPPEASAQPTSPATARGATLAPQAPPADNPVPLALLLGGLGVILTVVFVRLTRSDRAD